jgi:hypothetical protein
MPCGSADQLVPDGCVPRLLEPDGALTKVDAVSHNPPLVMISFGGDSARRKDSERNLKESGV